MAAPGVPVQPRSSAPPSAPPRNRALDGLRGLLAVVVALSHALLIAGYPQMQLLGAMAVVLFFAMSAYVLARAWDGRYLAFLARRFVRLWPTYAVCLLAGALLDGRPLHWPNLVWLGGFLPPANPPSWSMYVEARAMLAMPVLAACAAGGRRWRWRAGASAALLVLAWLVGDVALLGFAFLAGALLARVEAQSRWLERPACQWFGRVSYSLYLAHWPLLSAAFGIGGAPGVAVGLAGLPLAAWLLHLAVEAPSIRLSRRVDRWIGGAATVSAARRPAG